MPRISYVESPDSSLEVTKLLSSDFSSFNSADQNKCKMVCYRGEMFLKYVKFLDLHGITNKNADIKIP